MMRSHLAEGLMGIGSVFLAFGAVVFVISFAATRADAQRNVTSMHMTGMESIVGGAILLGVGMLLRRGMKKPADAARR
jgi:hypothetical protein